MLKNLVALGSGELVARGLQTMAFLLLARKLSIESFGHLALAMAVTSYLLLIVQQGFDNIAIREVSQKRWELLSAVECILGVRLAVATIVTLAACGYGLAAPDDAIHWLVLLLSGNYLASAVSLRWAFLASGRMAPVARLPLISQGCFLAGALLVGDARQASIAAVAQVVGEAACAVYLWWAFRAGHPRIRPRLDWSFTGTLLSESWPVSLSLLMGTMLYNFDVLALNWLGHGAEIGLYVACYRCVTVFGPLLGAMQSSLYPQFASAWPNFGAIRRWVLGMSVASAVLLGLAALALATFAEFVLVVLYGANYRAGGGLVRILVWVLPLQGARAVFRQVIFAWRRQRLDTWNILAATLTNVVLDVALVPVYGAMGCAWSTLCSEFVMLIACARGASLAARKAQ